MTYAERWKDFPDYIIGITREIWEDRGIATLDRYYAPDIPVRSPGSVVIGNKGVVAATLATLAEFPDRTLLGEDVIWCEGDTGALSGFMMQRGRMVVCGNAGKNLGDSMYDGTIYIGGEIKSLGVDAVEAELTDLDKAWLTRKLTQYGLVPDKGVDHFTKVVAGKQLWNYDNLEPNEKKLIL